MGKYEKNENNSKKLRDEMISLLHDLVYVLCAVILLFTFCFRLMIVSGTSMCDTLQNGDYLLVLNSTLSGSPEVGDIIVAAKDDFHDGEPIIKRVIAVEGQEVQIDFVQGIVYVDGVALDEPYTATPTSVSEGETFPQVVRPGCVFVMGDNRNDSKDSRSPQIGQIDRREILGKAIFLLFPGKNRWNGETDLGRIGGLCS